MEPKKITFKDRIKNPAFIAAAAGFAYTIYNKVAAANGLPAIPAGDFQLAVDLIAYAMIGTGVYASFTPKTK